MATLGVKIDTTLSNEKRRYPVASLYKGIAMDKVRTEQDRVLPVGETMTIDLTESRVFVLLVQSFSDFSNGIEVTYYSTKERESVEGLENIDFDKVTSKIVKLVPASSKEEIKETEDVETLYVNTEYEKVTLNITSLLVLEANNMQSIEIKNTSEKVDAIITVIY